MPSLTIGPNIYTANKASAYIINDQTLTPGAQITIDGTPISLAPQASALVIGRKTEPLFPSFVLPSLTIGPDIYTANKASAYIINDQTLTPGAQITVDGTPVSLAPQASALFLGSNTQSLAVASSKIGIGQIIMEGFGNRGGGSDGSDGGNGGPGSSLVTGGSVTNATSVTSESATNLI